MLNFKVRLKIHLILQQSHGCYVSVILCVSGDFQYINADHIDGNITHYHIQAKQSTAGLNLGGGSVHPVGSCLPSPLTQKADTSPHFNVVLQVKEKEM